MLYNSLIYHLLCTQKIWFLKAGAYLVRYIVWVTMLYPKSFLLFYPRWIPRFYINTHMCMWNVFHGKHSELQTAGEEYLTSRIRGNNAITISRFANKHLLQSLQADTEKFLKENLDSISQFDDFLGLELDELKSLLTNRNREVCVILLSRLFLLEEMEL